MPNAETATATDSKFTMYLFGGNKQKGLDKGKGITSRLGYDISNWQEFRNEILKSAIKNPSVYQYTHAHGDRYEQQMILQGLNQKPANILVGWNVDKNETHLTTVYLREI